MSWRTSLVVLVSLAGCFPASDKPLRPSKPATQSVDETRTYTLQGVVRDVDVKSGVVTIAHREIPGFMPAMTMDFTPKETSSLEVVGVGDEVEGPLAVIYEAGKVKDMNLARLEVTNPAPRTLKLDLGGGAATLAPKPLTLRPGEAVPDFAMTTQEGKPIKLSDLKGKIVVLTFIYTRCPLPDYCPAVDKKFHALADAINSVRSRSEVVRLLSVSFDPEHDTPETLRNHAQLQGAKPPLWTFAVASHEELRKVGERLGLIYGPMPTEIRHNMVTVVIAPDGTLARLDTGAAGKSWTPTEMLKTIIPLINASPK